MKKPVIPCAPDFWLIQPVFDENTVIDLVKVPIIAWEISTTEIAGHEDNILYPIPVDEAWAHEDGDWLIAYRNLTYTIDGIVLRDDTAVKDYFQKQVDRRIAQKKEKAEKMQSLGS